MAQIRAIPDAYRNGLVKLVDADETVANELKEGLMNVNPFLFEPDSVERIAPPIATISHADTVAVIDALIGLSMARADADMSVEDFVSDIADSLERGYVNDISLQSDKREKFEEQLSDLLNLPVFKVGAKALNLLYEHEHNLIGTRIVTDLRPIFGDDVDDPPVGAVIIHSLKLEYRDRDGIKELALAMDSRDVKILLEVLARAESKAESLKAFLSASQTHQIDFSED